jgi:phenylpropionate dioxygenase-like ring-hydroxylating dioxygenase large terminal subunit
MNAQLNERLTRTGPGTPCGALLRRYWQPVALVDEFDPAIDPKMAERPIKAVRVMGQDLVLFRESGGRWGLLDRDCPHRGADLAFGRHEGDGLRCPFHGWKFDAAGRCLETPAEPLGSRLCERVQQRSYPLVERSGVLFAWLGEPGREPPFPDYDCFAAPSSHTFAYKGMWHCNWLQAFEVGIDPCHTSFLHRFLEDASLEAVGDNAAGRQFRSASLGEVGGERWPMSRIMREFHRPDISFEAAPWGFRITTLRRMTEDLTHVRVTHEIFPQAFCIPLSPTLTITQWHVPIDDTHTYWYAFFTSYGTPVDKPAMREQRAPHIPPPLYIPKKGRHNDWGFDAQEQRTRTFLGMGEDDINIHDQWAVESMGPIQDRTREHLGTTDKVIMANRRQLLSAIDAVEAGGTAPFGADPALAPEQVGGPDSVDGIAPAGTWGTWWQEQARARQAATPWKAQAPAQPQRSEQVQA